MASNVFKNKISAGIGTTLTTVYTAPTGKTSTVIGLSLANISTSTVFGSVKLYDSSTTTSVYLIKDAPLPLSGALVVVGGDQKVVLENGDYIQVVSDTASSIDVVLSVMELSEGV